MSTSSASLVSVHVEGSFMSRLSKKYVKACSPQSLGITVYSDLTSMVNRKQCPGSVVSKLKELNMLSAWFVSLT